MNKLYILILILLISGCTKKNNVTNTINNTVTKVCRQVESISYDANGNYTGKQIRYYTGKKLDSILNFQGTNISARIIYNYVNEFERKGEFYDQDRKATGAYNIEKIDANYNIIEISAYLKAGQLTYRQTISYDCN